MTPSATISGPLVEPVMTDTRRPITPRSPTPRWSFEGRDTLVASSEGFRAKEYKGGVEVLEEERSPS